MTFIATKFSIAYLVFPFVLLEFNLSLKVYYRIYFIGHLCCLFAIFILPRIIRLYRKPIENDKEKIKDHIKKD